MTGKEIRLRAPEPSDLDALYRWENDPEEWRNSMTQTATTSRQALREFIENQNGRIMEEGQIRFMIEADGERAGTADLCEMSVRDRRAFVSIYVAERMRRKGIGKEALRILAEIAGECFGIETAVALVGEENTASQGLFESSGYRLTATLPGWSRHRGGKREDVRIYILDL